MCGHPSVYGLYLGASLLAGVLEKESSRRLLLRKKSGLRQFFFDLRLCNSDRWLCSGSSFKCHYLRHTVEDVFRPHPNQGDQTSTTYIALCRPNFVDLDDSCGRA